MKATVGEVESPKVKVTALPKSDGIAAIISPIKEVKVTGTGAIKPVTVKASVEKIKSTTVKLSDITPNFEMDNMPSIEHTNVKIASMKNSTSIDVKLTPVERFDVPNAPIISIDNIVPNVGDVKEMQIDIPIVPNIWELWNKSLE